MDSSDCNKRIEQTQFVSEKANQTEMQAREKKIIEDIIDVLHANSISTHEGEALLSFCAAALGRGVIGKKDACSSQIFAKKNVTAPPEKDFSYLEAKEQKPNCEVSIEYMKERMLAATSKAWDEWWEEVRNTAELMRQSSKYPYR